MRELMSIVIGFIFLGAIAGIGYRTVTTIIHNNQNNGQMEEQFAYIEGVWELYDGSNPEYQYMIRQNGRRTPFVCNDGDQYLGKEVRVRVQYVNGGPEFRIVSLSVIDGDVGTSGVPSNDSGEESTPVADRNRDIELVNSEIRPGMARREQLIQENYEALIKEKAYCKDKVKRLPYISSTIRADEIKRLETIKQNSLEQIAEIEQNIRTFETNFAGSVNRHDFVSSSFENEILGEIENKAAELKRRYSPGLNELQTYFSELTLPSR